MSLRAASIRDACYTGSFGDDRLKHSSGLGCPYCTSGDIWQPHVRTWVDTFVGKFGFERYECRKCRRGLFLRTQARISEPGPDVGGGESEMKS